MGPSTPKPKLELVEVTKRYADPTGDLAAGATVLAGVNLTVEQGQSLVITGPSGSGKSTLLNIIGVLDRPTSGRVLLDGADLASHNERQLAEVRNRRIGFVFQDHHLLPQCTALENILVPTLATRDPAVRRTAADAAARLLERVGLGEHRHHRPGELSGGQCQRVAVVRALINRPALLLADEPTGSLDRAAAASLTELLVELNREENVTLIVVTHSTELASHMSRAMELRDGVLLPSGDRS